MTRNSWRRPIRWIGGFMVALVVCCVVGILVFDVMIVWPAVSRIEKTIESAAPSERHPPAVVTDMLRRVYGNRIKNFVARDALAAGSTTRRLVEEAGTALLLPLHLSEREIESAFIASVYMGNRVHGFANAAQSQLGIPLDGVNVRQAARLVAISQAPGMLLRDAERLERRVLHLLSRPQQ